MIYKSFKEDHEQICAMVLDNSIEEKNVPYLKEDFYEVFFDTYITFKSKLLDLTDEPAVSHHPLASTFVTTHNNNSSTTSYAKLPKIELPVFTGEYLEWIPYSDMFISLVHNNPSLTDIQKYFYLKGSCKGSPLDIVNQYPASERNYSAAWEALRTRYQNKRKLIDQVLNKLFSIPHSNGSFSSIKELLDSTRSSLSLLKSLDIDIKTWDPILIYLTTQKMDKETRKDWEQSININENPSMDDLFKFLEVSFRTLESVEESVNSIEKPVSSSRSQLIKPYKRSLYTHNAAVNVNYCVCCQRRHPLYKCFKFSSLSPTEKRSVVSQNNICSNCLNSGHFYKQCKIAARCQQCQESHHTILHGAYAADIGQDRITTALSTTGEDENATALSHTQSTSHMNTHLTSLSVGQPSQILLATAQVLIKHSTGEYCVKALVDPGSQASFVTREICQLLNINKRRIEKTTVDGIGSTTRTSINHMVELNLTSKYDKNFTLSISALILSKITSYNPIDVKKCDLPNLESYQLSDPTFNLPSKIDILLGSDAYGDILLSKSIKIPNSVFLQESKFGWLVSGPIGKRASKSTVSINCCNLENLLRAFWEQEELIESRKLSIEEEACETYFLETYKRTADGRYEVHLPFRSLIQGKSMPLFQNTDYVALKRLKQLEASFKYRPQFAQAYKEFMAEYENLNHMSKVGIYPKDLPSKAYLLPHHGVFRESSVTTKLRVVFDGSSRTSDQSSLNDELVSGPALQNNLPTVITRWRRFKISFTADLEKMFRQIKVFKDHQLYQCILWRDPSTNQINIYKLNTVTYGTTSAPFLAIRILKQIALDGKDEYPLASKVIDSDTYVDDVISGCDTVEEAVNLTQQLVRLLGNSGFNLRKWSSNSIDLLRAIPSEFQNNSSSFPLQNPEMVKALGLSWDPKTDNSARLFDPLGWLAPTTIIAKVMFQNLWREGLNWTDPLPMNLHNDWSKYRESLKDIEKLSLPRWFKCRSITSTDLHAFCDSSKLAFAAVVYIRVVSEDGIVYVSLVQSKTKVAPLKVQTIPKLELCAAVLCAKLLNQVRSSIGLKINDVTFWTDSTTVLNWIKTQSSQLPVYEANRVSQIQRLTNISEWRYVSSSENPADCATRGLFPEDLKRHNIWWNGPQWLSEDPKMWPVIKLRNTNQSTSTKPILHSLAASTSTKPNSSDYPDYLSKYSSFNKLQRITAYILRFYYNLKSSIKRDVAGELHQFSGYLKTAELKRSRSLLVKMCQQISFRGELTCIKNKIPLPCNSSILKLQPFMDDEGVLRVGGRIQQADLSFGIKHPILLSKNDPISYLIFAEAHSKTLHGGVQLMQSYVAASYWVLSARTIAKSVKRNCVTCFKYAAKAATQIMGNLPQVRLNPARPFKHSGLDYAGPILIKQNTLRRSITTKGYICLFVCMCTKAVHLEVVSSMTTDDFLTAFRRFTSRRGPCTDLYSDCGTTFIGASKELQILHHRSKTSLPDHLAEGLHNHGTEWHFIPPASPHFGGLWEAGVKSTKHHLRRIMGERLLTYEELSTLLCQIESCLNSRPLCPLSTDPSDFAVLTPAHFLVGEPTTCIPEENLLDLNIDRLSRWKQIEKIKQHFWKRWSQEYLNRLQSRPKWNSLKRDVRVGDIVLILHERSLPGQWPLARVEETHPGSDGHCRVVTLYCNGKYIKRPITKICFLPSNDMSSPISKSSEDVQN
ncbi:uncharacterized protein LOC142235734 [Haematobia irritans]|uniref:uncharacterized protein LOC142235734 n=1 Tax=Haematobia irritans TaxID=7368 RepID=UPI003F507F3A